MLATKAATAALVILMKRNIIILSIIVAGALAFMYVLVRRSDTEIPVLDTPRRYGNIDAEPLDTVRFPGTLSAVKAEGDVLYGYVDSKKALYRWSFATHVMDTLMYTSSLFSGILSSIDLDAGIGAFYFFNANTNRAYKFLMGGMGKDSVSFGGMQMVSGVKGFGENDFFVRSTDYATSLTSIKKVNGLKHTTLYDFTHYADGGISADGFFLKDAASAKLYYVPYYNAEVIQFDASDNKVSKIITIDKTRPANSVVPTSHGYTISSKSRVINSAAAVDSTDLYVLSLTTSPGRHELPGTMIDVYSTVTGQYERSLQIPYFEGRPAALLDRSGSRLFVTFNNNVLSYKIR